MFGYKIRMNYKIAQKIKPSILIALYKSSAFALLPTIAVGSRGCFLEFTVVTTMTHSSTLRTTAQRSCQTTGPTFKYVLQHNGNV
jgi:hypothetical protein